MKLLKLKEINDKIVSQLKKKIFIYPTDTIYGIGCNAENAKKVNKIRKIKQRDKKPFSIVVPSVEYILENFKTKKEILDKYLPGPYTLILEKKNKNFLKHLSNTDFIGVRIPKHPFTKILQKTGKPIVSTSTNISGEKPANSVGEIDKRILKKVKFVIDAGTLSGKPSTLIKDGKIIER